MNDRLPFDILSRIFEYYGKEETLDHPLETLLLVCKTWRATALDHQRLWTRLKIWLGHDPSSSVWLARLPQRLERSGDSALLDFDLRCIFNSWRLPRDAAIQALHCPLQDNCFCRMKANITAQTLLQILAGPNGSLCRRWRSVYICVVSQIKPQTSLYYPTPNLTYLHLEYPYCEPKKALPVIPNLRTLKIDIFQYFSLPNVQHIRELELVVLQGRNHDISTLETAANVQKLTLVMDESIDTVYRLPDTLPQLSSLSLAGAMLPQNISSIRTPNLRRLSLQIFALPAFYAISQFQLPFQDLEELRLIWEGVDIAAYRVLKDITADIMSSCIRLRRIEGERKSLSVIMKLYWEQGTTMGTGGGLSGSRIVVMKSKGVRGEVRINVAEGNPGLEAGASTLRLIPPNIEWEDMFYDLLGRDTTKRGRSLLSYDSSLKER